MSDDPQTRLAHHEASLRRQEHHWRAGIDTTLHSDRAAVDIGIGALKTVILLNGGSLVALLAFLAQRWDKSDHDLTLRVLQHSHIFVWGVGAGALAFMVAYIYQSCHTGLLTNSIEPNSKGADPKAGAKGMRWCWRITGVTMLGLTILSFAAFVFGALEVMRAFEVM